MTNLLVEASVLVMFFFLGMAAHWLIMKKEQKPPIEEVVSTMKELGIKRFKEKDYEIEREEQ